MKNSSDALSAADEAWTMVAIERQTDHNGVMPTEREHESAALRHFQAIGAGKAESHRRAREEAAGMDPLDRVVRGLALARVWRELIPRPTEPKNIIPLHTLLTGHRSES